MLKRVTGALFEADAGSRIQLVVQARSNNGTEAARFEYDSTVLPAQTILGHPGCTFAVVPAIRQFEAIVVFDPAAPAGARYDLFEVNSAGGLTALGENVTSGASAPLIGFGVDGVRVAVAPMERDEKRRTAGGAAPWRVAAEDTRGGQEAGAGAEETGERSEDVEDEESENAGTSQGTSETGDRALQEERR